MKSQVVVPEIDVLVGVALWLSSRQVVLYEFSIARGQGIDMEAAKSKLNTALDTKGILTEQRSFVPHGPDITAIGSEYWQIECKGAGTGGRTTQRNNFDRAVSSAVSYYRESSPDYGHEALNRARPVLGLALPQTAFYMSELKRRVRKELRKALNLWVLVYEPSDARIRAVDPDGEY